MRTITSMCSLAMLAPLGVAAPAPEHGARVVVEAVVEGSVVGALMIAGETAPAAIEIGGAPSADVRAPAQSLRPIDGEAGASRRPAPEGGPSGEAAAPASAEPAASRDPRAERSSEIAGVGAWQRDVAVMLGAGVAGTLLFVAGGRRARRRT
ncbi:MAG TPA: hypothetical protein VK922_10865 [Gemmatimonadaceae bacterium]|nr:hypothetical protein [Gemmatimonadaceae bacterium]